MQKYGRKYSVMTTSPIWFIGWLLISFAISYEMFIIGRIITGFGAGIALSSAQIYVSECSDPSTRGIVGSFPAISMSVGVLFSYILGSFLSWNVLGMVSCVIGSLVFFAVIKLPKSPVWLRSQGRKEEAERAVEWLQLSNFNLNISDGLSDHKEKPYSRKVLFTRPVFMSMFIAIGLLAIQQLSGIDAIIFFTVEIFRSAGNKIYNKTILVQ